MLIMDMPSSCEKCKLHSFVGKDCDVVCQVKGTTQSYEDAYNGKPDWCPLKPMPEKKDICGTYNSEYYANGGMMPSAKMGYNTCIDELLKGEEG